MTRPTDSHPHMDQTLSYLSITGLKVPLIVNFRNASLEFKRVANLYQKPHP